MPEPRKLSTPVTDGTVVLILAGGLGTRLRSVFRTGPKALAPVANRPFLDYLLNWVRLAGFSEVILCVGYKHKDIEDRYKSGKDWGIRLSYSVENEPLGTAGAIKLAQRRIRSRDFVVLNGDSFVEVNFRDLLHFHKSRGALGTIVLAKAPAVGRYGQVQVNRSGRILAFLEKDSSAAKRRAKTKWINAGIYVLSREVLTSIPAKRALSLEKDVFQNIGTQPFYGFPANGYFIDIGVPEDYQRAQRELPKRLTYEHSS